MLLKLFRKKSEDANAALMKELENYELPSFSVVVMNTLRLLRDPDASITEVAEQIKADPALNVKVLKAVNSAAFGLVSKVENIIHAVSLLGPFRLETIVLSLAVQDSLPPISTPVFDANTFWSTSLKRASLANRLARDLHPSTAVESYTAALLQDMAIPVLINIKGKTYNELLATWKNEETADLASLEKEAFGFDHAQAGKIMAAEWEMPQLLSDAIGSHHLAIEKEDIFAAVKLASLVPYDGPTNDCEALTRACAAACGKTEEEITEVINAAFDDAGGLI